MDEHAEAPRVCAGCGAVIGDTSGRYADDPAFQCNCRPQRPRPAEDEDA